MKRDIANAHELVNRAKMDPLLQKQLEQIRSLSEKQYAHEAVRIGRMRGLYFTESEWLEVVPHKKKAA